MKHYDCGYFGEFKNIVWIKMPNDWETSRADRWLYVDACIASEIIFLLNNGVRTIASCCGHGVEPPWVIVDEESYDIMDNLGYSYLIIKSSGERDYLLKGIDIGEQPCYNYPESHMKKWNRLHYKVKK